MGIFKKPRVNKAITRPVIRYFGGKYRLAPWIISHLPPHRVYIEVFGGSAAVMLRKNKSKIEVYNDLDESLVQLFKVLQNKEKANELAYRLRYTLFSRKEYEESYLSTNDSIEIARKTIIRTFFGLGSSASNEKQAGFRGKQVNVNVYLHDSKVFSTQWWHIRQFHQRFCDVVVESMDAIDLIKRDDLPDVLFYIDPPYVGIKGYKHNIDDNYHKRLLDTVASIKGKAVISGYASPIYEGYGFKRVEKTTRDMAANLKTEVLWIKE